MEVLEAVAAQGLDSFLAAKFLKKHDFVAFLEDLVSFIESVVKEFPPSRLSVWIRACLVLLLVHDALSSGT